ncbi:uncharacterized protein LOC105282650 isoform X1 [Ooceraea biroi]|uniref:Protein sleepless n=1 Tax=Ooceraea biroi TaxID=2015173 RepID=A0A026W6Q2_OOCBI|nr:uncharacterized protein LOC105282650 isoform X1 [Ooceraea biroi]EZA51648.1 hypothetical protein X777_08832 [Ooceraea biroi]
MIGVSTGVIILFGFLLAAAHSREERLSCYECNTDLRQGHKGDCNDPYTPGDLVACPQNEPHRCHKSIVLYKNILITVRACVLSRQVDGYCNYEDRFPQSSIECYFCEENGCNGKRPLEPTSEWCLGLLVVISWMLT